MKAKISDMLSVRSLVFAGLSLVLFLFIAGYAWSRIRPASQQPYLALDGIEHGQATDKNTLVLSGIAHNSTQLSINTFPVLLTDAQGFAHRIALSPGENHISFVLEDRFGRTQTETVSLFSTAPIADITLLENATPADN